MARSDFAAPRLRSHADTASVRIDVIGGMVLGDAGLFGNSRLGRLSLLFVDLSRELA
jgi:hypothetical protein